MRFNFDNVKKFKIIIRNNLTKELKVSQYMSTKDSEDSSWDELPELQNYPEVKVSAAYLDYIRRRHKKKADQGQQVAAYDQYDPHWQNVGPPQQVPTKPIQLAQSDPGYSKEHPSEAKLPKDVLGRTSAFGSFLGSQIEGPAEWEQYYQNWEHIGPQVSVIHSYKVPLDKNEIDFCKRYGFYFIKELGRGGYGVVWLVEDRKVLKRGMACKVIDLNEFRSPPGRVHDVPLYEAIEEMTREAQLMKTLDHPNVVKFEQLFYIHDPHTGFPFIRTLLFMELCQGDVAKLLEQHPNKKFSQNEARRVMVDVCRGLKYLHDKDVVHFDIKPNNILYLTDSNTGDRVYKLTDFGLSQRFPNHEQSYVSTAGGTPNYSAPELELPGYSPAKCADIYSLGTVLIILLLGKSEGFKARLNLATLWNPGQYRSWGLSNEAGDLVRRMTFTRYDNRPTIEQVIGHRWLTAAN